MKSTPRSIACSFDADIVDVHRPCSEHVWIECVADGFPSSTPGQFAQLRCREETADDERETTWPTDGFPPLHGEEWRVDTPLLRRPFSIADRWEDAEDRTHLVFISRNVGRGTAWLERVERGQSLNLTGPLGTGFKLPDSDDPLILIGGGVGIPPMLYLARCLAQQERSRVTIILGVLSRELLPAALRDAPCADATPTHCITYPGGVTFPTVITTDDGSLGARGRVTDALRRWHERNRGVRPIVYACGPEPMLRAIATHTRTYDFPCQLCIERLMGCGLGTCLSCIVKLRDDAKPEGWRWGLTCSDGPVFQRDELYDYTSD